MANGKDSFVFHAEWLDRIEPLDSKERAMMTESIIRYGLFHEEPEFSGALLGLFRSISQRIDADQAHYKEVSEKRRAARLNKLEQNETNDNKRKQKKTKHDDTDTASDTDSDTDTDTDITLTSNRKSKRFTPPTLEEVKAYCLESGYRIDAERFIDYYESNGWIVGRNKMKDWKAAVRNWSKREDEKPKKEERRDPYEDVDFSWLREIHQVGG